MSTNDHGELARRLAAVVRQVPGVSHLAPGSGVEVATYFTGGKVVGVRLDDDKVEVHVTVKRLPLAPVVAEIHDDIHRVLSLFGEPRYVQVVVADIDVHALTGGRIHANL